MAAGNTEINHNNTIMEIWFNNHTFLKVYQNVTYIKLVTLEHLIQL